MCILVQLPVSWLEGKLGTSLGINKYGDFEFVSTMANAYGAVNTNHNRNNPTKNEARKKGNEKSKQQKKKV